MANDNIQVEVLDSSSEFRPGRKGGSVNWMQLLSGVLLLVFGLVCVFCRSRCSWAFLRLSPCA